MLTESKHALAGWLKQPVKTYGKKIETSQAQKSAAQHVRKHQQWEKAWWEPGPFWPSDPLTSNDSPGSPCWKVAPERITGSEVGPPDRSSVPFFWLLLLLFTSCGLFPSPHTRKALARRFFFCLEGRNARRTEELHRGGAGKGEDRVLTV